MVRTDNESHVRGGLVVERRRLRQVAIRSHDPLCAIEEYPTEAPVRIDDTWIRLDRRAVQRLCTFLVIPLTVQDIAEVLQRKGRRESDSL